jgi:hypothetical protein
MISHAILLSDRVTRPKNHVVVRATKGSVVYGISDDPTGPSGIVCPLKLTYQKTRPFSGRDSRCNVLIWGTARPGVFSTGTYLSRVIVPEIAEVRIVDRNEVELPARRLLAHRYVPYVAFVPEDSDEATVYGVCYDPTEKAAALCILASGIDPETIDRAIPVIYERSTHAECNRMLLRILREHYIDRTPAEVSQDLAERRGKQFENMFSQFFMPPKTEDDPISLRMRVAQYFDRRGLPLDMQVEELRIAA